ncbi:fimbrial protein [Ralstonia flatus]|uniref:fimbrial protein n=1 Tax=Ralstonia flatus TaxID=3058601 RepID=UPI00292DF2CE|nr:fimbrial protein [Ralstonia sp. LMG 32965]
MQDRTMTSQGNKTWVSLFQRKSNLVLGGLKVLAMIFVMRFSVTQVHAANCTYYPGHSAKTVSFAMPAELTVPRDAPVGAVVWESPVYLFSSPSNSYRCTATAKIGVKSMTGNIGEANTDFIIGDTGLAWNLKRVDLGLLSPDISKGLEIAAGGYGFDGASYQIIIKKVGQVSAGASVPAGVIGYMSINNEVFPVAFFMSNEARVGTLTCKTPDVTVKMGGQNRIGQFKGVGTALAPVNFSIGLKQCPEGISKISYLLKPNTKIVDGSRSVVALDAASTAKGVGLQILTESGNPAPFNELISFSGYDKAGGDFNIPLKAAYYRTSSVVEPGTANSSVTLIMSYD